MVAACGGFVLLRTSGREAVQQIARTHEVRGQRKPGQPGLPRRRLQEESCTIGWTTDHVQPDRSLSAAAQLFLRQRTRVRVRGIMAVDLENFLVATLG